MAPPIFLLIEFKGFFFGGGENDEEIKSLGEVEWMCRVIMDEKKYRLNSF